MAIMDLNLSKIADSANEKIDDYIKRNPQHLELTVGRAVSIKCDYCNKKSLIICLAARAKYCPVCGCEINKSEAQKND